MKKILVIGLLLLIVACSKEKELGNMVVQGKIKGIKKGTLYLKKMRDTLNSFCRFYSFIWKRLLYAFR